MAAEVFQERLSLVLAELTHRRVQVAKRRRVEQEVLSIVLASGGECTVPDDQIRQLSPVLQQRLRSAKMNRRRRRKKAARKQRRDRKCPRSPSVSSGSCSSSPPPAATAGEDTTGCHSRSLWPFLQGLQDEAAARLEDSAGLARVQQQVAMTQEIPRRS